MITTMVIILLIMALVAIIMWYEHNLAMKPLKSVDWDCNWCGGDNKKNENKCRHCGYDR